MIQKGLYAKNKTSVQRLLGLSQSQVLVDFAATLSASEKASSKLCHGSSVTAVELFVKDAPMTTM